jgi:hypothetical protein
MGNGTDAAEPLHHHRDFPIRATLNEFFEAAELDNVQAYLMHSVGGVEQYGDLAVALDAGDRVDRNAAQLFGVCGSFEIKFHGHPQS